MDSIVKEKSHTGSFVKQNEQFVFVVFGITALYFSILSYTGQKIDKRIRPYTSIDIFIKADP